MKLQALKSNCQAHVFAAWHPCCDAQSGYRIQMKSSSLPTLFDRRHYLRASPSGRKSQNDTTFKLILGLSCFIYHNPTSPWPDTHREWWNHCLGTPALLEAEQMEKRHPCSGKPQEVRRRNVLPCKQQQKPRALSAKASLLVLQCQIQPWLLPHSSLALALPTLHPCFASTALAPLLQTCRVICSPIQQSGMQHFHENTSSSSKTSPEQWAEVEPPLSSQLTRGHGAPKGHLGQAQRAVAITIVTERQKRLVGCAVVTIYIWPG